MVKKLKVQKYNIYKKKYQKSDKAKSDPFSTIESQLTTIHSGLARVMRENYTPY